MSFDPLLPSLSQKLPVLYAYIGWARYYNGDVSDSPVGRHSELTTDPSLIMEVNAFTPSQDGKYRSGVGSGKIKGSFHVVFVALDPETQTKKAVGLYAAAALEDSKDYPTAVTSEAVLIPVHNRPTVSGWVDGQHMRRWASRPNRKSHPSLQEQFEQIRESIGPLITKSIELFEQRQPESLPKTPDPNRC